MTIQINILYTDHDSVATFQEYYRASTISASVTQRRLTVLFNGVNIVVSDYKVYYNEHHKNGNECSQGFFQLTQGKLICKIFRVQWNGRIKSYHGSNVGTTKVTRTTLAATKTTTAAITITEVLSCLLKRWKEKLQIHSLQMLLLIQLAN